MTDIEEREAIERFRAAVEKREAGVQKDAQHHHRSRCKFDVESARRFATIGGITLADAMLLLNAIERGIHHKPSNPTQ